MNRKIIPVALIVVSLVVAAFCTNNKSAYVKAASPAPQGFAVIELFTSEGCSSCPAAEKAVEELVKQYPDNVYVMAFHVDYWNRLGWTDTFSSEAYTARQNAYAAQFNLESIYTPQAVINGRYQFVGSDKAQLQTVTSGELIREGTNDIDITAKPGSGKTLLIDYKMKEGGDQLHIVLVQKEATTNITAGENAGHKLHHINLVRGFKTVTNAAGSVTFNLPAGLRIEDVKIMAYRQKAGMPVTAIKQVSVGTSVE